jgi:CoA-dependent NAD(P)H sulfur oxidoreductase
MDNVKLVVVGGVAAGTKAASRARRLLPETAEVVVYQQEPEPSISECGLPYLLSGIVESRDRLVARTPEEFAERGVKVLASHRVESVDPESKRLVVRDLLRGEEFEDRYDRLVISTGARAVFPPLPGADLDGVFVLRFLTDADRILAYVDKYAPQRASIVGGGYIGLEVAENLHSRGMEVNLLEVSGDVAGGYSEEISGRIKDHLEERGVRVRTGAAVEGFLGENRVEAVRVGGRSVPSEIVIVGVGAEPSVELARGLGAQIGATGAIRVDRHMKTSVPDVWAAGDCVESTNLVSGEPVWMPLGDTANQMGRVAGTNAAKGEDVLEFPGVLGTGIFKVFDLDVGRTGLSQEDARNAGYDPVSVDLEALDRAGYYPGAGKIFVELVADRSSGRLLGAEALGARADKLTDICATALWGHLTVEDLINLDLAYAPPYGPALSPVIQAATVLATKLS